MKRTTSYKKRLLSFLLCGALIFTNCSQIAAASEAEETIFDDGGETLSVADSSEAEADVSAGSVEDSGEAEAVISAEDGENTDGSETAGGEETVLFEDDEIQDETEPGTTEETDTGDEILLFTDGTVDAAGSSAAGFLITGWEYNDPDGYLTLDESTGTYTLALGGADTENPENNPTLDDIIEILPASITATLDGADEAQEITLERWTCEDYPAADPESGKLTQAPTGSYSFTATLPEGYALADGAAALTVTVCFDEPSAATLTQDSSGCYLITSADDLVAFAKLGDTISANAKVTADIDMSGVSWTPISTYEGTFDGQGHTISNLSYTTSSGNVVGGLFNNLQGATVKNISLSDLSLNVTGEGVEVGGIAGFTTINDMVTITNCHILSGTIKVSEEGSNTTEAGGIVGRVSTATIDNCSNAATIDADGIAGGIVGLASPP